jgi:S1-C subfamily serine protease
VLRNPVIRRASQSVVRILGTACGIGIEGTGWFARPHLVVTAAHVVAGEDDTRVQLLGSTRLLRATPVLFDVRNDIAFLVVHAARRRPLPLQSPVDGAAVAIVGYPEDGPLTSTPGRVGRTATVLSQNAYGHGPVSRTITALAGRVRHGNSGGPAIDTRGRVQASVFAARLTTSGGFGTPSTIVADALRARQEPVSTGSCADG